MYFDESIIFSFFKFLLLLIFHIISSLSRVTKRWKLRPEQARQNTTTIVVSAPYDNKTTLSINIVSVFEWIYSTFLFINTTFKQNRLLTSLSQINWNVWDLFGFVGINCVWHIKSLQGVSIVLSVSVAKSTGLPTLRV